MADSNSSVSAIESHTDGADQSVAKIIIVRHGETIWNALRKMQGQADIDLNETGRQQATAVITDPDLRERHIGVLQGQVYNPQELMKLLPEAYEALMSQNQQVPGGGESRKQLYERGTTSLQRIGDKHKGERVVVVSHGALIQALYGRACPGGDPGDIRNASIGIFHLSDGGIWSVKSWNDASHLNFTGYLKPVFGGNEGFP